MNVTVLGLGYAASVSNTRVRGIMDGNALFFEPVAGSREHEELWSLAGLRWWSGDSQAAQVGSGVGLAWVDR